MSRTIDEKVVEMRFDNQHFENNVKESMSTLDKLKQKLNLTGASKSLENINTTANKMNFNGMAGALDSVHSKFSALEVMGITALANITNSAVEAGKRMVKALTIDPIMDGFSEYEMTLNAIQTTMAGTGKTAKEVEDQLKLLDVYADKTVYSTADMLNNLPKFTNAGVELEKATTAMIGIANATALAGGDAGKASIAFYNLGQAIGTGYLSRMDYNSINNAGIATMEWKNQMVEAAIAAGTLKKVGDDQYQAGKKTMTLQQLFIDGLQEQWATTEVMMKVFQDYGDETTEIGKKSYAAAQDIKTFSMMMDSLKATAGTGWKDTWQIIFGGLDEAKVFWTGLTNFISNIVTSIADFRNGILEGALGKSFKGLFDNIKKTGDTVKDAIKPIKEYSAVVDEIIGGKWGNGQARWDALTQAGYDWAHAQNLVNEKLGNSLRRATNYKEAQDEVAKTQEQTTETTSELIEELLKLSDAELKAKGYTDEQIKAFRELQKVVEKTGIPLKEFIKNIDEIDGRWILINSFKNIGQGLVATFTAIKDAWRETFFGEDSTGDDVIASLSEGLFNLIAAFHKFTTYLMVSDTAAKNLKDTFKGVFAILDMVLTIVGGPIKIGLKLLGQLFKALDLSADGILAFTGGIGRSVSAFHDWFESIFDCTEIFKAIAPYIKAGASAVWEWIKSLGETEVIQKFVNYLTKAKQAIVDWVNGLKEAENIGKYIMDGLQNGLGEGVKNVVNFVINLGKQLLDGIKNVLGIHSPSTEFFEIGLNIIQGLINGIKDGLSGIGNFFKSIATSVNDFLGKELVSGFGFTIGDYLLMFLAGTALTVISRKITKSMKNIGLMMLKGLAGGLKSGIMLPFNAIKAVALALINGFKKILGIHSPSKEFFEIGTNIIQGLFNGIKSLLGMVYELVLSAGGKIIEIVRNLDLGSVLTLALGGGFVFALIKIAKAFSAFEGLGNLLFEAGETLQVFQGTLRSFSMNLKAEAIKSIAIAIGILAASVAVLAMLDTGKVWLSALAIGFLVALLGGLTAVVGKFGTGNGLEFGKIALSLLGLAVAMGIMAMALRTISKIDDTKCLQVIGGFAGITAALLLMMYSVGKNGDKMAKLGSTFMSIGIALLMMAHVVKILGKMELNEIIQGGVAIVAFSGIMVGLMAATKLLTGSTNVGKIGPTIAKVGAALLMMAFVAKIMGSMKTEELIQGGIAIAVFSGIIVGLMAATKLINGSKNVANIGGAIAGVGGALLMMAITARIVGGMKVDDLAKGIIATAAFGGIVVGLMAATKLVSGKDLAKVGTTILMVSIAIGLLGVTAALMSLMSWEGLAKGLVAVGFLSAFMAGLIAVTKLVPQGIMGTLISITVSIGILTIAIAALSMIDGSRLAGATAALGVVLGMFALVIAATSLAKTATATLIVLTVAIGVIGGVLYLLAQLPIESSMAAAAGISMILLAMAAALAITSLIGAAATTGIIALVVMTGVVALLGLIIKDLSGIDVESAMGSVKAITTLLIGMSAALVLLGVVGLMGPAAFIGVAALATLIVGLTAVVVAIGALMQNPNLQSFLDTGIQTLIELASGIGQAIGAFVSGVMTQISAGLPVIGANLSLFMSNLMPFITGVKMVDGTVLKGVGILAAAIIALTAADLINGIVSFLSGGSSFADLGMELSMFMMNAMPFILMSKQIDPAIMTGIKTLAEAIMILTGANILESLTSWLTGGNSLGDFGAQLGDLGTSLSTFVTKLGTFTQEQVTTVNCAAQAIKTLAEAAKTIPNDGGLWGALCGENSLATFGGYLPGLGTNLSQFVANLGTFTEDQVSTIDCAGRAIKALAEAAKEIPNEGGLWGAIVGDNSLATFGSYLPGLGTNLNGFITNLGSFDESHIATVDCAGKAIKTLAEAAKTIPNEGGLWAKIVGENSLATFADKLPGLATKLHEFITNLGSFNESSINTVNSACNAIKSIAELGKIDINATGSGLETFGANMVKFAKKVSEFVTNFSGVGANTITSAITKTKELVEMAKTVAGTNIDAIKTFGESLKKFAKDGVKGFVKEFSGNTPKDDAKKAAEGLVTAAIKGAEGKKDDMKKAFKALAEKAADGLDSDDMKKKATSAGKDLCQGLINGLKNKDKRDQVYNAAFSLGQLAVQGEKDGQQSKSPSKATEKAGKWLGEGLVIGIKQMGNKVYGAGKSMGEEATNSISSALNTALNLLNSDMDTQPTIRPVLDLSDVESGVGYLSGMFNRGPSLAVATNLGAISYGMNSRSQNGTNDDVVSAITKLGKSLGNAKGDTYNINGMTYDDGSNVADAVKQLYRAAKMERRV